MAFAKVSDVSVGTKLVADGGFPCIADGAVVEVADEGRGLFVSCAEGRHYLDGQTDDGTEYIGLSVA